ncbi:GtrA family protein [Halovenus sp. WSH3]|uniref:GtrA family protein n=1 Tax=Halovenus carboxidivorans TaxID=2692199 RepID=A0A6B0T0Y7_9EURY|nr:GtrA family protein [Halovenus carboxidivorans]MXR51724.1 GtrA family protein [Halovenus carboxidivorans]
MSGDSRVESLLHLGRFKKFVSVGVVGASIETVVVAVLTTLFGVGAVPAKAVGAELSISTMFLINDRWTFAASGALSFRAVVGRWGKSHLVRAVGLTVGFVVLILLVRIPDFELLIRGVDFWPVVANGIGIGIGMVFNYVAESLYTWQVA